MDEGYVKLGLPYQSLSGAGTTLLPCLRGKTTLEIIQKLIKLTLQRPLIRWLGEWIRLNHACLCGDLGPEAGDTEPWTLLMMLTQSISDISQSFILIYVQSQLPMRPVVLAHCSIKLYPSDCDGVLKNKGQSSNSILLITKLHAWNSACLEDRGTHPASVDWLLPLAVKRLHPDSWRLTIVQCLCLSRIWAPGLHV